MSRSRSLGLRRLLFLRDGRELQGGVGSLGWSSGCECGAASGVGEDWSGGDRGEEEVLVLVLEERGMVRGFFERSAARSRACCGEYAALRILWASSSSSGRRLRLRLRKHMSRELLVRAEGLCLGSGCEAGAELLRDSGNDEDWNGDDYVEEKVLVIEERGMARGFFERSGSPSKACCGEYAALRFIRSSFFSSVRRLWLRD